MSEPSEKESEEHGGESLAGSPGALDRQAEEAIRNDREGKTLPVDDSDCMWVYDPTVETLETFLGDSLNRPPPTPEEMAKMRELARIDPAMAAVLDLYDMGGLDVNAILALRSWRIRDDIRLFDQEPEA
jgi:hypothetical protein